MNNNSEYYEDSLEQERGYAERLEDTVRCLRIDLEDAKTAQALAVAQAVAKTHYVMFRLIAEAKHYAQHGEGRAFLLEAIKQAEETLASVAPATEELAAKEEE